MRSSMKVLFAQDAHDLSSMGCSMPPPEMQVDAVVTNRPKKKYNSSFRDFSSDRNQLLSLGNISGRSSNRGLGLIFPSTVSFQLVQDQGTIPPNVTDKASDVNEWSPIFCRTPLLDPLNLDDDISPIFPLPPSLSPVNSPAKRPNSRSLIVESAPLSAEEILTQDITSVVLNDDLFVQEDVKAVLSSPVPNTLTVDIAEYGMSLCYQPDKATSVGESYPEAEVSDTTKHPNKGSPLLCDNVGLPIILSTVPIYYGKARDGTSSPSMSPSHDGTRSRSLSTHAVVRSGVTSRHRRPHRIRQPIETGFPSMTPSPTNSPKLYRLPVHRKEGDCEAQSPGLSLEPAVSVAPTKMSSHQSLVLCAQLSKRRSNVHDSIRSDTRCIPWNTPTSRSPLALGYPLGTLHRHPLE